MNPLGEFEDLGEDENVAPQHPPYLPPVRPGVHPPRWTAKFTLCTPSLPQGVQFVGTMTGKVDVIADFTTLGESHFVWPSPVPLQTL